MDCPENMVSEWHTVVKKIVSDRVEAVVSACHCLTVLATVSLCVYLSVYVQRLSNSKVDLFLMLETRGETHTLLTEIFMEAALHGLQHMVSEVDCITSTTEYDDYYTPWYMYL